MVERLPSLLAEVGWAPDTFSGFTFILSTFSGFTFFLSIFSGFTFSATSCT